MWSPSWSRGRLSALEDAIKRGVPAAPQRSTVPAPAAKEERPPLPEERDYGLDIPAPAPAERPAPDAPRAPAPQGAAAPVSAGDSAFWPGFAAGLRGKVPPSINPYLNNSDLVGGLGVDGLMVGPVDDALAAAAEALDRPDDARRYRKAAETLRARLAAEARSFID